MYSTTFEHSLDNTTTFRAYDMVQDWVRAQGGKVKENHRPNLVVAAFGSSSSKARPWEKMSKRTIRFDVSQPGSQVIVKVHVSSSLMKDRDVVTHGEEARLNWAQGLASLWARLGGTETETGKATESAGAPTSLEKSLKSGKNMTRLGMVVTIAGYVLVVISPTITSIVVSGLGLIILVQGMMRVRRIKKILGLTK